MSFVDAGNLADSESSMQDSASIHLLIGDKEKDGKSDMGDSSGIGSFVDAANELANSSSTIPVENFRGSLGMDQSNNTLGLDNISQILTDMGITGDTKNQGTDNATTESGEKGVEETNENTVESDPNVIADSTPGIEKLLGPPGMDSSTPSIGIDDIDQLLADMEDVNSNQKESKAEESPIETSTEPKTEEKSDSSKTNKDNAHEDESKSEEEVHVTTADVEGDEDLVDQIPRVSDNTDQTEDNAETEIDEPKSTIQIERGDDAEVPGSELDVADDLKKEMDVNDNAEVPQAEPAVDDDLQEDVDVNDDAEITNEEQGAHEVTETNEEAVESEKYADAPPDALILQDADAEQVEEFNETVEGTPAELAKQEDHICNEDRKADEVIENNVPTETPGETIEEVSETQDVLEQNENDSPKEGEGQEDGTNEDQQDTDNKEADSEIYVTTCRSNVSGSSGVSQYTQFTTETASTYQHKNTAATTTQFLGDDFSVISEKSLAKDQSSNTSLQVGSIPLMTTLETEEYRKERERLELRKVALVEMSNSFRRISEGSAEDSETRTDSKLPSPSTTIYTPGVTTSIPPPPPPPPPPRATERSTYGDVEMKEFNRGRKIEITKRAMGQRPHELPNYPLIVEKTVDVTQLIKIGVLLIVTGCIGSIYAERTCHFASILKYIGYYAEPFHLHAGMYEYTSLDSVFTGHAFCLPYDNYYSASEPILPRVGGAVAIFAGVSSAFILWFYLIMLRTNTFLWNLGIYLAIVACICQASTFYFFFDEVCAEEVCRIGPGSFMSALALFTYATAAYTMHKNRPTNTRGQPTKLYESETDVKSSSYTAPTIPTIV